MFSQEHQKSSLHVYKLRIIIKKKLYYLYSFFFH